MENTNNVKSQKIHYAPGGEWSNTKVNCTKYYTTDVFHTEDKIKVTCKLCLRNLNRYK